MTIETLLTNATLPDGRRADIGIRGGVIAAIGAQERRGVREVHDLQGDLVLPGLVDGHMHLDKTLMGLPWMGHAAEPFRMSRIETDKRILPNLPLDTAARAANLAQLCVTHGTAHIRTHVDVDLEGKLTKLEGVLAAREKLAGAVTIQIVAFPQSGVMRCPGVLDLLDAAMRSTAPISSAASIRSRSTAIPRASSTASSRWRRSTGAASTSICTSPARWGCSTCRRSARARWRTACRARSRSATASRWAG
jgi:cytosine/adenosine deaminase-related metal-dependent hydrolase